MGLLNFVFVYGLILMQFIGCPQSVHYRMGDLFEWSNGTYRLIHRDGTVYIFDAEEHLTQISYLDGLSESFPYNSNNQVTSATVFYHYNAVHKLASVTDGRGNQTVYHYDNDGNLTSVVDGEGTETPISMMPRAGWSL